MPMTINGQDTIQKGQCICPPSCNAVSNNEAVMTDWIVISMIFVSVFDNFFIFYFSLLFIDKKTYLQDEICSVIVYIDIYIVSYIF